MDLSKKIWLIVTAETVKVFDLDKTIFKSFKICFITRIAMQGWGSELLVEGKILRKANILIQKILRKANIFLGEGGEGKSMKTKRPKHFKMSFFRPWTSIFKNNSIILNTFRNSRAPFPHVGPPIFTILWGVLHPTVISALLLWKPWCLNMAAFFGFN